MANRKSTKYIVIHTTASSGPLTVASLRAQHRARGFSDIGYGGWIDRSGKEQRGRGYDKIGAHVAGFNSVSVGVSWEGGHKGYDMNPVQEDKLLQVVKRLVKQYPGAKICGHRDLSPDGDRDGVVEPHEWTKTCPWFDAEVWAMNHGLPHTNFSGKAGAKGVAKQPVPDGPDKRTMWLQRLLRMAGAQIVADGWDGPKTQAAIKQFERDNGLPETGSFDTRATVDLLKALASGTVSDAPKRRPAVTALAQKVAAVDRVATEKVTNSAGGTMMSLAAIKETSDQVGGIVATFAGYVPDWFVPAALVAGMLFFGYGYYRRSQRQSEAKAALQ